MYPAPDAIPFVHQSSDLARRQRALADLRGAAGSMARRRSIRRPLQRAARRQADAESALGRLDGAISMVEESGDHERAARFAARAAPPLTMRPRTVNVLIGAMALCDALLVSTALQAGYSTITPAGALVLSIGIGVALVALGKKTGERLATFHRLDDQGPRWGVLAALAAAVVVIASVGLTLLRVEPAWSWPFLVLAVPAGSTALTWLTHNPPAAELVEKEKRLRRAQRRARRHDRRLVRCLAGHDALRACAEQRYRARLAAALRRAIADGGLAGDDLELHRRVVSLLMTDTIPPNPKPDELRAARRQLWAVRTRSLPPPAPRRVVLAVESEVAS